MSTAVLWTQRNGLRCASGSQANASAGTHQSKAILTAVPVTVCHPKVFNGTVKYTGYSINGKPCTMSLTEWWLIVDPSKGSLEKVNEILRDKGKKRLKHWPIEWEDADRSDPAFDKKKDMIRRCV